MKKITRTAIITATASMAILFASCSGGSKNADHQEHSDSALHTGEHTFTCPMHPEVTGKADDKCPKCGMALIHNDNPENSAKYYMKFISSPVDIIAGKETELSFIPKIKDKDDAQVALQVKHEKKIHLIIVSNDLSSYNHIHPEYKSSGSYDVKHNFASGGSYLLFADYAPSGGSAQLEKIPVMVKGPSKSDVTYKENRLKSTVDGYTVSLETKGGKFVTNQEMHISGIIMQNGKVVQATQFENYMGAKAHMVIISVNDKEYLHVHPEIENGNLDLHTTFNKPGVYRGWLQFQTNGKVHTADFTIVVTEGTASDGHKHSHGEKMEDIKD